MAVRKVLMVDDEPDLIELCRICLESPGGWQLLGASSGAQALEISAREAPDLILLDMGLPDMNGLEALARLRQQHATEGTPVIFFTARPEAARPGGATPGVLGTISKPFDPLALPEQVKRLMGS